MIVARFHLRTLCCTPSRIGLSPTIETLNLNYNSLFSPFLSLTVAYVAAMTVLWAVQCPRFTSTMR